MKLSGIFWTIILIGVFYLTLTLGIGWFIGAYLLWTIVGIIIHLNSDYRFFTSGYYNEDIDFEEMWKGFLESPYLFLLPHLFSVGILAGFFGGLYLLVININNKLDSVDLKPKPKPKKQSYGEFKDGFKSENL